MLSTPMLSWLTREGHTVRAEPELLRSLQRWSKSEVSAHGGLGELLRETLLQAVGGSSDCLDKAGGISEPGEPSSNFKARLSRWERGR
jgi:hypothetical protein